MSIAFIVFFWLLHRLSAKMGIVQPVFNSLIAFTLGVIIFGRLFYILAEWRDLQFHFLRFLDGESSIFWFIKDIFIMQNYNLSFMGWVLGFFIIFFMKTRKEKKQNKLLYLDVIMASFLSASIIWYLGAFLWGQIYGTPTEWFGIVYSNPESIVPFTTAIFPLPIFYAVGSLLILIATVYMYGKNSTPWFTGSFGLALFGGLLLVGEFFNGSDDMFRAFFYLNLNQIGWFIAILAGIYGIFRQIKI
jgi:prolipoprotein diacylglyceryltransferase